MSQEEPAWRAELRRAIGEAVIAASCDGECGLSEDECSSEHPIRVAAWTFDVVSDIEAPVNWIAAVVDTALAPHIQSAEERGRRQALAEAAEKIRRGWDETRGATQAAKVMAFAADLIDPAKPEQS